MVGPWGHGVAERAPLDHQLFDGGGPPVPAQGMERQRSGVAKQSITYVLFINQSRC